jgi:hypothetical protein
MPQGGATVLSAWLRTLTSGVHLLRVVAADVEQVMAVDEESIAGQNFEIGNLVALE